MKKWISFLALFLILSGLGWAAESKKKESQTKSSAKTSETSGSYWTGDGGKNLKLAVLEPTGKGLSPSEQWMLSLVQGSITGDLNKYSAMTVIDRQNLEKILAQQTESLSGNYSDDDFISIGKLTNARYILAGSISKTATSYMLELSVSDVQTGERKASYPPKSVSPAALENLSAVKEASADILAQLGVKLTDAGIKELKQPVAVIQVQAQTALARGITAQKQGTEVAALSYYFQAASYDPFLMEAANRSSILYANISSGNIGDNVRNDIQWRKDWVARLTETEQYFDSFNKTASMPYTLFYVSDEIKQGAVNYQNETVIMGGIETHLHGSGIWTVSMERALRAVYDGLNATKRKDIWELANWPQRGVTNLNAFARRNGNFSVVFELLNSQNKVIGKQTLQAGGSWELNWSGRPVINVNADDEKTLDFQNVNANDITDSMTIRVATINGSDAETAARNGVLQIRAITRKEFDKNGRYKFTRGEIQGFTNDAARKVEIVSGVLVIPDTIWGDPVKFIDDKAFYNEGYYSVTIPHSVTSIGSMAFYTPEQFLWDTLRITIGANVDMGSSFGRASNGGGGLDYDLRNYYYKNGKKAGTYTYTAVLMVWFWRYSP
jgi:TolB-like protein